MVRMQKYSLFVIVALVVCIFLHPSYVHADTVVPAHIAEDTIWTTEASPYIVTEDLIIDSTATLTIEPGMQVNIAPGAKIIVDGNIIAVGTSEEFISFDSAVSDTLWGGFIFSDLSAGTLEYVNISDADTAISANDADVNIRYITFSDIRIPAQVTLATRFIHANSMFMSSELEGWDVQEGITLDDVVWSGGDGVYQIQNLMTVSENTSLAISPGASLVFGTEGRINIFGNLIAHGTTDTHIAMSNSGDYGIYAFPGSSADFAYTDISRGTINISGGTLSFAHGRITNTGQRCIWAYSTAATIASSVLDGCSTGIDIGDTAVFSIADTDIQNSWEGMRVSYGARADMQRIYMRDIQGIGIQAYENASLHIVDSEIKNTARAITAFSNSTVEIKDSLIDTFIDQYGILAAESTLQISDTEILRGAYGIDQYLGSLDAARLTIHDVAKGIEAIGQSREGTKVRVQLHDSEIYNTSDYALRIFDQSGDSEIRNNSIYDTNGKNVLYQGAGIDISNNWWGSKIGPDPVSMAPDVSFIQYAPWLKYDPKNSRAPVIIIPGITGTRLLKAYDNNEEVWPDLFGLIKHPADKFLNDLKLNIDATENVNFPIQIGDIIRGIHEEGANVDVFESLISDLQNKDGYIENIDLFVFPYDWRFDSKTSADKLKIKIDQILEDTGYHKVNIISHSMGGLVTKRYIAENDDSKIDKLFFVGTPHLGAPKAFKAITYGDNMGYKINLKIFDLNILNTKKLKEISQNMPSSYELLPSEAFGDYVNNKGNNLNILNTKKLMIDEGRNASMFNFAETLHNLVDMPPVYTSAQVFDFAGCSTKTIGGFDITKKLLSREDKVSLKYMTGDETVPLKSAEAMNQGQNYYSNIGTHAELPSIARVRGAIGDIIAGRPIVTDDTFSSSQSICAQSGKSVEIHSPVTLDIYDDQGRHTGPTADGSIEYNIPNVVYNIIGEEKFAYLPDGPQYRLIQHAEGLGMYDMYIHNISPEDSITSSAYFTNLPIQTLEMSGELHISPTSTFYTVSLDQNGDGTVDASVVSKDTLEILNADIIAQISHSGGALLQTKEPIKNIEKNPETTKEVNVQKTKIEKKVYKKVRNTTANTGIQNTENQIGNIQNPAIQKPITRRWYIRLRAIIKKLFIR